VRVPKIDGLLTAAAKSKRPVRSIEFDGKTLKIEFFGEATGAVPAVAVAAAPVAANVAPAAPFKPPAPPKFVPGTEFPDDESPLNPIDLILTPPTLRHEATN
jgi:hypothetical protein